MARFAPFLVNTRFYTPNGRCTKKIKRNQTQGIETEQISLYSV